MGCKFTWCYIAVTWWVAGSCGNVLSSIAPVQTGTKTEVARIAKKFSARRASFGAWQGSREYSESTPWPGLHGSLKACVWVSDGEDFEAHRRLLVRPVLNRAVKQIRADKGSVTAVPNEVKMLKYNIVNVNLLWQGGSTRGAQVVRVLSQGVLGAFPGVHGDLVAVQQHLCSQLEDSYPTTLRMVVYHLGRREELYLFEQSSLLFVNTRALGPAVPHSLPHAKIVH